MSHHLGGAFRSVGILALLTIGRQSENDGQKQLFHEVHLLSPNVKLTKVTHASCSIRLLCRVFRAWQMRGARCPKQRPAECSKAGTKRQKSRGLNAPV